MFEAEMLLLSPARKQELYMDYARSYILSRGCLDAQNRSLKVLNGLASLWNLSSEEQDMWYKQAAKRIEETKSLLDRFVE